MDKKATGTIYRIAPKNFKPNVPDFDLRKVSCAIEALKSPAVNVRYLGFKALIFRGEKHFGKFEFEFGCGGAH